MIEIVVALYLILSVSIEGWEISTRTDLKISAN